MTTINPESGSKVDGRLLDRLAMIPTKTEATSPSHLGPALHRMERMMVLCPRSLPRFLREFRNKEWWYTGAFDARSGVYVSWYFVRVNAVDKVTMTVFDPALAVGELPRVSQLCRLDPAPATAGLCLRGTGRGGLTTSYELTSTGRWDFTLTSKSLSAKIHIEQTIPAFTKFDNEMRDRYAIIHYFQSRATGTIAVEGGREYHLKDALTYHDHCYGRVPGRTGWHWIAVQNERIALTVLINYGAYAQRFAQVWANPETRSPRAGEWVRLEQDVSFEREDPEKPDGVWTITSTDLDLQVTPQQLVTDRTRIFPGVGGLVNLAHTEMFVKAQGRVRVDGVWIDTGLTAGVMEEHHGRW